MRCLIRFMRRGCERRRLRIMGKIGEGNDLGAMVDAITPELVSERGWHLERKRMQLWIKLRKIKKNSCYCSQRGIK